MERQSLMMKPIKVNNKVNSLNNYSWDHDSTGDSINVNGEIMNKWPPRSYSCSFCKRDFKSAQALGGHMNVHRKERARQLRLSPPLINYHLFNINVEPSEDSWIRPRSPSSSPSKMLSLFASALPPLVSPSLSSISPPSSGYIKNCVSNFKKDDEINLGLHLDLEIGLLGDSKEHLDLELRLGYSN